MTLIASKPQAHEALTHADRQIIAQVLTWDAMREVTPEEVETIAIVHDIVWVKLTDNRAIPLHVETFRSIRRQQLEALPSIDDDVAFVTALEAKLEADVVTESCRSAEEAIEVDSLRDGTYRVWSGMTFIGIVFKRSSDWIAKPTSDCQERLYSSSEQAIQAVVDDWRHGT